MGKGGQKEGRGIAEEFLKLRQIAGYAAAEHDVGALSAAGRRDFPHDRLVHGGRQGGTGGAQKILSVHKAASGVCDHADARFAGGKEEAEGHGGREDLERIERRNSGSGSPAEGGGGRQREPEAGKAPRPGYAGDPGDVRRHDAETLEGVRQCGRQQFGPLGRGAPFLRAREGTFLLQHKLDAALGGVHDQRGC